ncbi:hypothetical protein [Herpetosiphon geysericola]|uniref:DUF1579 domain-containing protein n=1 Tax=Herpetosiphon geysericola TaxID=70996 RepID=A0A0P6Z061_9CHLR|nr:hypothetical protein [Herpetosiphon geysericola]KPL90169.1 hypothetical protein SE18_08145 [Herpetosiphon geysericola]
MALERLAAAPTDFDFVLGDWNVRHRRLKDRLVGSTEWIEFTGQMSTQAVLGGYGNVEDNLLNLPEGPYRAIAIRSFNPQTMSWSIWWLDGRMPGQLDVPVVGNFVDEVGTFYADDTLRGKPIKVRFLWFAVTPDELRWEQAFSADNGDTWETNWIMEFSRI